MAKIKENKENLENETEEQINLQADENIDEEENSKKGEKVAKAKMMQKDENNNFIALPKGLENFVNKDLLSINANVLLEENSNLAIGTLLISEDFGANFKKCPNEDISAKENIKLAMLKDDVFKDGVYAVLIEGEVVLNNVDASAIKKAFMQNLIINNKE